MRERTFITYTEALSLLEENKQTFDAETLPIDECHGRILAEDLCADRNFPPFDRVTMDGIAIDFKSFEEGKRTFKIEAISPAGSPRVHLQDKSACVEVMTGTMLPDGTDTVIRYEDVNIENQTAMLLPEAEVIHQQNIHFEGMDIPKGSPIVKAGSVISSAEINVAAAIGADTLKVVKMPKAVIISTGDELVDIKEIPAAHQIRRSNVYGIKNTLKEWGIEADLSHIPDSEEKLTKEISDLLKAYDLLIFTGGVSKGKYDHLPQVLEKLEVSRYFHKVQQRPGKPFWFGGNPSGKTVFALPGNPVSSFVCLYAYLKFWLQKSLHLPTQQYWVKLKNEVRFAPDLIYFPEAKLSFEEDATLSAEVILGNGSGDFTNLVKTDGFMMLPQDKTVFEAGSCYPFIPYRNILSL